MNKRIKMIRKDVKKGEIKISKGMFFLPDDLKKLKGRWMLYIKKGLLVRLEEKKKEDKKKKG